ncbi:MAG: tetratricopeptide repeat protein [Bdellovibrionales bacterium]|nr:tetratricopeptide repeat protein [Bdellovibrionales bacterium]
MKILSRTTLWRTTLWRGILFGRGVVVGVVAISGTVNPAAAQSEPVSMRMFSAAQDAGRGALAADSVQPLARHERAVQLNEQGVELVFQGNQSGGVAKIKQALAHDPQNTTILYNLAGLYLAQGAHQEAMAMMGQALAHEPDDAAFLNRFAEAALLSKDLSAAVTAMERMAVVEPGNAELSLKLGTLYAMQKRWSEAETTLERAREALGDDNRVLMNLANVLVVQEKYEEALPLLKIAQQQRPCAETAITLALAYEGLGRFREAVGQYREAKRYGEQGAELDAHIEKLEQAVRQ